MNMLKEKVDVTNHKKMRFQQLSVAHQSTVCVYAKHDVHKEREGAHGHLKTVARKIRPEFGRFFLTSDVKQVFSLLDKHNSDESIPGIDVVIMDVDHGSIKLLEVINKRPGLKQTSSLPLISTVMVLPEPATGGQLQSGLTSKEALQQIEDVGGAGYVCPHNTSSQDLLFVAVEALSRRKVVEVTFRDLKAAKIKAKRYPFLPIFSKAIGLRDEDDEDTDDDFAGGFDDQGSKAGTDSEVAGSASRSGPSLKELDDWTDSSSLLPSFVRENRKRVVQKSKAVSTSQRSTVGLGESTGKLNIQDRQQADKAIVKLLNTGANLPEEEEDRRGSLKSVGSISVGSSSGSRTGSPRSGTESDPEAPETPWQGRDGGTLTTNSVADPEAVESHTSEATGMSELHGQKAARAQALNAAADITASAAAAAAANTKDARRGASKKVEKGNLPIPSMTTAEDIDDDTSMVSALEGPDSVTGGGGSQQGLTIEAPSGTTPRGAEPRSTGTSPSGRRTKRGGFVHVQQVTDAGRTDLLSHLLNTSTRPSFQKGKRLLPARQGDDFSVSSNGTESSAQSNSMGPFITKEFPDAKVRHSVGGLNLRLAEEQWRVINRSNYELDTLKGGHAMDAKDVQHKLAFTTVKNTESQTDLAGLPSEDKEATQESTPLSNAAPASSSRKMRSEADEQVQTATRVLKRIARDTVPDVQLNELIPVKLSHGKVTVGDRDLLEAGLKAEGEGDFDTAITMYRRAGLHTSKPHLSQMFLAMVHYTIGKFMQALEHLNNAIQAIDSVSHKATYSQDDEFIAVFNRALVHFRLGNDECGLIDIMRATTLNPEHLRAREVLSLAQRRMSKYGEAIESSKSNIMLRRDKIIAEREAGKDRKAKLALRRRQKANQWMVRVRDSLESRDGSVIGNASLNSNMKPESSSASRKRRGATASIASDASQASQFEELNALAPSSQLLTVHCEVEDKGGGTFQSRKQQREKALMKDSSNSGSMPGQALRAFKLTNGFRENLYEELFNEPSQLQKSLVVPPELRSESDLHTIATSLRLYSFLRTCSEKTIRELARVLEYRVMHNKVGTSLYSQNSAAEGAVFVLRGSLTGRLEATESSYGKLIVGEVHQNEVVSYVDLLFDDPHSDIVRELYGNIVKDREKKQSEMESMANLEEDPPPAPPTPGASPSRGASIRKGQESSRSKGGHNTPHAGPHGSAHSLSQKRASLSLLGKSALLASETKVEDMPLPDKLPRPLQRGMYITYSPATVLCEILLLDKEKFKELLYPQAVAEFRKRLDVVDGCGVFIGWSYEDKVRLARMGSKKTYRSGDVVLKQGVKPDCVSFIMKGMCKSYKAPNKSTVLGVKLREAKEKAEKHDLKYTYDARLRNSLTRGLLNIHPKTAERGKRSLRAKTHVTVSEAQRYSIGVEIKLLERDLAKAIEAEKAQLLEEPSMDEVKEHITDKLSEVSTLQWPQLIGEACVSDPDNGTSRGTIVADTSLEVLSVHKSQLQTFRVKEDVLERIKYRSVCYPEDEELLAQKARAEAWEHERQLIVKNLSTPKEEYLEPFYV